MVALGTMYSFALFSSLDNLKPASLTRDTQSGQGNLPRRKAFSLVLFTALYPIGLPVLGREGQNQMLTQPYLLGCEIADLWAGSRE